MGPRIKRGTAIVSLGTMRMVVIVSTARLNVTNADTFEFDTIFG